jgi:alpha-galactosidase
MNLKISQLGSNPPVSGQIARRHFLAGGTSWCLAGWLAGCHGLASTTSATETAAVTIVHDPAFHTWTLRNDVFQAVLRMNRGTGSLQLDELRNLATQEIWRLAPGAGSFPVAVELEDGRRLNAESSFLVTGQSITELDRGGQALTLELSEADGPLGLTLTFDLYPGQPVLRHQARILNRLPRPVTVRKVNFLAWEFAGTAPAFDAFAVHQWVLAPREANFDPVETPLTTDGLVLSTGSGGEFCAWLALRDDRHRGLFAGLEFNGRAELSARRINDRVTLAAEVATLHHPLRPGASMTLPAAFVGVFHGDWDEAGYRTQRYVEAAIAPAPPDQNFPYVAWDSWGYLQDINEITLRQNAKIAADLGMELFIVDLGWAKRMGDWVADPAKFPSGLRALSDYVHDLGMKFGLHFAFSEADPESLSLAANPDWTSSETYNFHGGESLCLGHQPVRDWIIERAVTLVRSYRVDWLLQDGQTLVKECMKSTHSHHPEDSNWANSEEGLDLIVSEVRARTGVVWENCANGGSMMTFKMARNYVTSITNDASGSLGSRQGVYGATFPFPPRFADRYMPHQHLDEYTTRSFMFGGPWIFMNRLPELTPAELDLAAREIAVYKSMRTSIREGRVTHLTPRPDTGLIDAIQSYHPKLNTAIAIVTRENAADDVYPLVFRGLVPAQLYQVRFETAAARYLMTGTQLMTRGVDVSLPAPFSAEIVYLDPVNE